MDGDQVGEARRIWQSLLLATATTLDSFKVCVDSATDLWDHEAALRRMSECSVELAREMRQIASTL